MKSSRSTLNLHDACAHICDFVLAFYITPDTFSSLRLQLQLQL